ncbi:succinyldiaminopimelate transaminase [Leekyejoonella antrihumi]|uniref:Succinyldiaminopimelate transaminase n=1 Tax=Leekyejoonella antrihumi TaxID=1660198 RepID=A0A563DWB1_9MICO|nr:succinyldiaminopimelate transaminase [Leekyejoonella antrihumi]TWP34560.1 succinyldiaminopimelate transaminase [Leekyejoonella antrihumi]
MTSRSLPGFPWDSIADAKRLASEHPDGLIDLSVGTPVDPTPQVLQDALSAAANAHGYPQVHGTPDLRQGVADWFARRRGASGVDPDGVMPTVGSKELIAWLPTLLDLGVGDVVGCPHLAYPTYDVGARLAGARPWAAHSLLQYGPTRPKLLWINSPGNPHGQVLGLEHLAKVVSWARTRGVIVASDECYAEFDWRDEPEGLSTPSILDDRVCGGSHEGLLAVYSLSKQSSVAGYRAAFVAGDVSLVNRLVQVRKHAGMIVPWPVQRALLAGVTDDEHVAQQKAIYARRREVLRAAMVQAGWQIDYSDAGLYLWASQGMSCRASVDELARIGILVTPGDFYGSAGDQHVRVALTATDDQIRTAAARITARWASA